MIIAHLADLHLGYRAYHRSTMRGFNVREADVLGAFARAVEHVVRLQPQLVLVAGDVFHSVRPSNSAIAAAFRHFSALTERLPGVPVMIVAGDRDSPRSTETENILALFREIPGLTVVTDGAERVRFAELDCSVLCLPHNALVRHGPTTELLRLEPDADVAHNVLLLHGAVQGGFANRQLRSLTPGGGATVSGKLIDPGVWDYVALGHHHIATELAPNVWYSGATERTSSDVWLESRSAKGFLTFDTGSRRATFHELETRLVLELEPIQAAGLSSAEVDHRIGEVVAREPGGLQGKMVRLVIYDVARDVLRELNHRRIRQLKAEALHFHLDARSPAVRRSPTGAVSPLRQSLPDQVREYLENHWQLTSASLDRSRVMDLAAEYLERVDDSGEES